MRPRQPGQSLRQRLDSGTHCSTRHTPTRVLKGMGKQPFCDRGSEEWDGHERRYPTLLTCIPTQVGRPAWEDGLENWGGNRHL